MSVNCRNCHHFFVTWQKNHPYGCRALGFKSAKIPSMEVFASSGMECLKFTPKQSDTAEDNSKDVQKKSTDRKFDGYA